MERSGSRQRSLPRRTSEPSGTEQRRRLPDQPVRMAAGETRQRNLDQIAGGGSTGPATESRSPPAGRKRVRTNSTASLSPSFGPVDDRDSRDLDEETTIIPALSRHLHRMNPTLVHSFMYVDATAARLARRPYVVSYGGIATRRSWPGHPLKRSLFRFASAGARLILTRAQRPLITFCQPMGFGRVWCRTGSESPTSRCAPTTEARTSCVRRVPNESANAFGVDRRVLGRTRAPLRVRARPRGTRLRRAPARAPRARAAASARSHPIRR